MLGTEVLFCSQFEGVCLIYVHIVKITLLCNNTYMEKVSNNFIKLSPKSIITNAKELLAFLDLRMSEPNDTELL